VARDRPGRHRAIPRPARQIRNSSSGSPFYYYNDQGNPVVIGVFSQQYCGAGCPNSVHNEWPNVITRITPEYLSIISWYRAAFPE
jgi:hypothetical protein